MRVDVARPLELLAADLTRVLGQLVVRLAMLPQRAGPAERFPAHRADKRLLARVQPNVDQVARGLAELLAAVLALVRVRALCVLAHVVHCHRLGFQPLVADVALRVELCLDAPSVAVRRGLLVRPQDVDPMERQVALVALERFHLPVDGKVRLQLREIAERSTARFAYAGVAGGVPLLRVGSQHEIRRKGLATYGARKWSLHGVLIESVKFQTLFATQHFPASLAR